MMSKFLYHNTLTVIKKKTRIGLINQFRSTFCLFIHKEYTPETITVKSHILTFCYDFFLLSFIVFGFMVFLYACHNVYINLFTSGEVPSQ